MPYKPPIHGVRRDYEPREVRDRERFARDSRDPRDMRDPREVSLVSGDNMQQW